MVSPSRKVRNRKGSNEILNSWLILFCINKDGIKWIRHNLKARNGKKIIIDFFNSELVSLPAGWQGLRALRTLRETKLASNKIFPA